MHQLISDRDNVFSDAKKAADVHNTLRLKGAAGQKLADAATKVQAARRRAHNTHLVFQDTAQLFEHKRVADTKRALQQLIMSEMAAHATALEHLTRALQSVATVEPDAAMAEVRSALVPQSISAEDEELAASGRGPPFVGIHAFPDLALPAPLLIAAGAGHGGAGAGAASGQPGAGLTGGATPSVSGPGLGGSLYAGALPSPAAAAPAPLPSAFPPRGPHRTASATASSGTGAAVAASPPRVASGHTQQQQQALAQAAAASVMARAGSHGAGHRGPVLRADAAAANAAAGILPSPAAGGYTPSPAGAGTSGAGVASNPPSPAEGPGGHSRGGSGGSGFFGRFVSALTPGGLRSRSQSPAPGATGVPASPSSAAAASAGPVISAPISTTLYTSAAAATAAPIRPTGAGLPPDAGSQAGLASPATSFVSAATGASGPV